jgi:hypothetical protein
LIKKGIKTSNCEISKKEGDAFYYKVTLTIGDKVMEPASKGMVKDGKLIRIEPVNPGIYSNLRSVGDAE